MIFMNWPIPAVVGAIVLATCALSFAQSDDEAFRKCFNSAIPQQVIDGCSAIIKAATVDKEDLAAAFKDRGVAYDDLGEYELALQDFDRAIAINRDDWDVYNSRGATKTALKRYALAVEDF